MAVDLIIYIIIVLALLVGLRNTMGTRHEDEPQKPNPLSGVDKSDSASNDPSKAFLGKPEEKDSGDDQDHTPGTGNIEIANSAVESALSQISVHDKSFDLKRFISGAQDAFVIIVEAFAKGDRETLKPLLAKEVYEAFDKAISAREERAEKQETEIQAIRKVEVTNAVLRDSMAYISLRITAEEVSVTKDDEGEVIAGNPDRIYDMTDLWTFGKDLKSKDPVWYLYETRDDQIEDHDSVSIPESG